MVIEYTFRRSYTPGAAAVALTLRRCSRAQALPTRSRRTRSRRTRAQAWRTRPGAEPPRRSARPERTDGFNVGGENILIEDPNDISTIKLADFGLTA